jgi:hypothetical protein
MLTTCSACSRHVKNAAQLCPFCGVTVVPAQVVMASTLTATRAKRAFGAAAVAVTLVACGSVEPGTSTSGGSSSGSSTSSGGSSGLVYGGPPIDAGPDADAQPLPVKDAAVPSDAAKDGEAGGPAPPYGAPPGN